MSTDNNLHSEFEICINSIENAFERTKNSMQCSISVSTMEIIDSIHGLKKLSISEGEVLLFQRNTLRDLLNQMEEFIKNNSSIPSYIKGRIVPVTILSWELYQNALLLHKTLDEKVLSADEVKSKSKYSTFKEIFIEEDYKKYINVLSEVEPPLIDGNWKFLNNVVGGKGVICSWFGYLLTNGKIKRISRQELAYVVNSEIKNVCIGSDGRSIGEESNKYKDDYISQLEVLLNF